jgi:hypothetical protein
VPPPPGADRLGGEQCGGRPIGDRVLIQPVATWLSHDRAPDGGKQPGHPATRDLATLVTDPPG